MWQVFAATDLPLNKAFGIAWLSPQVSGDKKHDAVSACFKTLHGLWEAASGRGYTATVWPSGHLHVLHHVVEHAVCRFQCKLSISSQSCALSIGPVNVVVSVRAACMQIRVQLGAEGFPLYGDTMYANMAHISPSKVGKPQQHSTITVN